MPQNHSLSGGQQRLVEFARCLMLDPAVVVLDEPSMGLAPNTLRTVFDAVRDMNARGTTVLLVGSARIGAVGFGPARTAGVIVCCYAHVRPAAPLKITTHE